MAISGQSFCKSAWSGFLNNLKNCAKFYFALSIASMFTWIGILGVAAINLGLCYLIMTYLVDVSSPAGPWFAVAVLSFYIPTVCLGMFDEAVIATM